MASQPALAQARKELGPLCTSVDTPADKQIDACNKIIALKVFSGADLATIYFWRGVAFTKKGDYTQVIADTTEAIRLWPGQIALYNQRGSAYYDKGEYDIAIADYNEALRLGPPNASILHTAVTPGGAKANMSSDCGLRPGHPARSEDGGSLFLPEPRRSQTGARRPRWRARRHQRGDPRRPGAADAADQARRALARQRRL